MLKNLKKLFSVAEEDLELDEKNITDEHYEAFRNELKQFNLDKTTSDFNDFSNDKMSGNSFRGIEGLNNSVEDIKVREIDSTESLKEAMNAGEPAIGGRKNFDFEKEIDKAYNEEPMNKKVVHFVENAKGRSNHDKKTVDKNNDNNKRVYDVKDLAINPDEYVLRDIISPMKGVVRKEANPTVNKKTIENPQNKSKIIKIKELRNQVDVSEIDATKAKYKDKKQEKETEKEEQTLPFDVLENVSLQTRSTLHETSRFTIVEDSTGEMRLFIDEGEE